MNMVLMMEKDDLEDDRSSVGRIDVTDFFIKQSILDAKIVTLGIAKKLSIVASEFKLTLDDLSIHNAMKCTYNLNYYCRTNEEMNERWWIINFSVNFKCTRFQRQFSSNRLITAKQCGKCFKRMDHDDTEHFSEIVTLNEHTLRHMDTWTHLT